MKALIALLLTLSTALANAGTEITFLEPKVDELFECAGPKGMCFFQGPVFCRVNIFTKDDIELREVIGTTKQRVMGRAAYGVQGKDARVVIYQCELL